MDNSHKSRFADESTFAHTSTVSRGKVLDMLSFENMRDVPDLTGQIAPENETEMFKKMYSDYLEFKQGAESIQHEHEVSREVTENLTAFMLYQVNLYAILGARIAVPGKDELNKALVQDEFATADGRASLYAEISKLVPAS